MADLNFRQVVRVSLTGATFSFIAGYVGAVALSSASTASVGSVTGVLARLGLDLARLSLPESERRDLHSAVLVDVSICFGYLLGSIITGMVVGPSLYYRMRVSWRYGLGLVFESITLTLFLVLAKYEISSYLLFGGLSMGLQNSLTSVYSGSLLRTTHIGGAWTDIGVVCGQAVHKLFYRCFGPKDEYDLLKPELWRLKFHVPVMACYFFGGMSGFAAYYRFGLDVLAAPILFTGIVGLIAIYLDRRKKQLRRAQGRQRIYEVLEPPVVNMGPLSSQNNTAEDELERTGDDVSPDDMESDNHESNPMLIRTSTRPSSTIYTTDASPQEREHLVPHRLYMRNPTRQLVSIRTPITHSGADHLSTTPPRSSGNFNRDQRFPTGPLSEDRILELSSATYTSFSSAPEDERQ